MADMESDKLAAIIATAVAAGVNASPPKAELPAPLKWAAFILSGIAVSAVTGMGIWLVSTTAAVQITVKEISTRLDERAKADATIQQMRDSEVDSRLEALEGKAPTRAR